MVKPSEVPDAWINKRVLVTMPNGTRFEGKMTYYYFIFEDCKTLNKDGSFRAKSIKIRDFSSKGCRDSDDWNFELVEELPDIHTVADLFAHQDKYVGSEIEVSGAFRGKFIGAEVQPNDDYYTYVKLGDVRYVDKDRRMSAVSKNAWKHIGGYTSNDTRVTVKIAKTNTKTNTKTSQDLTPEQVEAKLIEYVQQRWPSINKELSPRYWIDRGNIGTYHIAETFVAILKELTEPEKE